MSTFSPVKFSKDEMLDDLRTLMLGVVRMNLWTAGLPAAQRLVGSALKESEFSNLIYDTGVSAEEIGLDVSQWPIHEVFDQMYDFAAHGVVRFPFSELSDETALSISMALVYDLVGSRLSDEVGYGGGDLGQKCLQVARLACARSVLEGHGRMLFFNVQEETEDDLTIRDVALLAGMEETSVRNAANPKNKNPLATKKVDGNTYIEPVAARTWLASRDRYVAIQYRPDNAEIDLATTGFKFPFEAWTLFADRAEARGMSLEEVWANISHGSCVPRFDNAPEGLALDKQMTERLGQLLDLDAELLALRLREVRALSETSRVRSAIAELASRSTRSA